MLIIAGFLIDAAISEEHELEAEVTDFPVESGTDATDHVRSLPRRVTVTGVVSDSPIDNAEFVRLLEESDALPSEIALAKLEEIFELRQAVTIVTSLKTYENMLMLSLSIPRDRETGQALRFTATFRQLIIVENRRSVVRVSAPRASKQRYMGIRGTPEFQIRGAELLNPRGEVVAQWDPEKKTYFDPKTGKKLSSEEAFARAEPTQDDILSGRGSTRRVVPTTNAEGKTVWRNPDGTPLARDLSGGAYDANGKPLPAWFVDTATDEDFVEGLNNPDYNKNNDPIPGVGSSLPELPDDLNNVEI